MRERTGYIPSEQETIQQIVYNLVLACATAVSLHCCSLLRDVEQLNERLSCLRYVSVSRNGLSELSRLLGSWKSQQEEYREALGNYVLHCRETEERFPARCAGIAVEK